MQYTHRKLQRSVIDTRSVSSGRPNVSSSGSIRTGYPGEMRLRARPDLRQLDDGRGGEAHVLHADPFPLAVRVVPAGEDSGRAEAHLGERGAGGAAADRVQLRLQANSAPALLKVRDDLWVV